MQNHCRFFVCLLASFSSTLCSMEQTLPWHRELVSSVALTKPILDSNAVYICNDAGTVFVLDTTRIHKEKTTAKLSKFSFTKTGQFEIKQLGNGKKFLKTASGLLLLLDSRARKIMPLCVREHASLASLSNEVFKNYLLRYSANSEYQMVHLEKGDRSVGEAVIAWSDLRQEAFMHNGKAYSAWGDRLMVGDGKNVITYSIWDELQLPVVLSNDFLLLASTKEEKIGIFSLAQERLLTSFNLDGQPMAPVADDKFVYLTMIRKHDAVLRIFKIDDLVALGSMAAKFLTINSSIK